MIHKFSDLETPAEFPETPSISTPEMLDFHNYLKKDYPGGYVRYFDSGHFLLAHRLLFHWTIKRGAIGDYTGYNDRYCFQTEEIATEALRLWNTPTDDSPGRWHRHPDTGRRREWNEDGTFSETINW